MMSSAELSSNEERIADALLANLHNIYFGTQIVDAVDQDRAAKQALDIAFGQCNRDGLLAVLNGNTHSQLRDKVVCLLDSKDVAPRG